MDELKQKYLECGGVFCPYCGSHEIEGTAGVDVDMGIGTQIVECKTCFKDWKDVYQLIDVQPPDIVS